ncbi:MAG: DUF934 domain-containing protein [Halieaceae bacterium]|jgi:uncharacterized protein (DUF934 family)|nr:DUF934 domain-containing protein [Halieaceae bacterium]
MDRLERSERATGEYPAEHANGDADAHCSLQEWRLLGRPADAKLRLRGDDDVDEDLEALRSAATITVDFAAFTDGRGFSLARRLRRRGFRGELVADGQLLPDQWALLESCGFTRLACSELERAAERCRRVTRPAKLGGWQPNP